MRTVSHRQCKCPALAINQRLSCMSSLNTRLLQWHIEQGKCPAVSINCSCKCW